MEKVLVLVSGGLDSRIACNLLQSQLKVEAVHFILPFSGGCCSDKFCVFKFCQINGIKLHIFDCTSGSLFNEYLEIIRNPKSQRGAGLNPCRACHAFMLKKAKELSDKLKIKIIATGEVLGERPLSQTKKALAIIDKDIGFEVLRPLSAKLLQETSYEKENLVDREKLLDIKGRRRVKQFEMADKYKINVPPIGGGCLLCDKKYCEKLKPILCNPELSYHDIELLSIGRHFPGIILGKNEKENLILEKEAGIKIIPVQPGATALIKDKSLIEEAKELIRKYSKNKINSFEIHNS